MLFVPINSIDLSQDDSQWKKVFDKTWPAYKAWFMKEGLKARPGYLTSVRAFEQHFPELLPIFQHLSKMVSAGDVASRFLTMYSPPPYMSGCSQIAWTRDIPMLIRNYDYSPKYFEGLVMKTKWNKEIIGMSDCMWGLLDGVNEDGLCASLTFGGRRITGDGFGIPIVLRYCLETCSTTAEAIETMLKIPVHMAYNITLLDADLNFATIYFAPGQKTQVTASAVGTNHQEEVTWPDYAVMTQTVERRTILEHCLVDPYETHESLLHRFLQPPLFNTSYEKSFGTLYSAAYNPIEKSVNYFWRGKSIKQSLDNFVPGKQKVTFQASAHRLMTI